MGRPVFCVSHTVLGKGIPFFADLATSPIRLGNPTVVQGNAVTHLSCPVLK